MTEQRITAGRVLSKLEKHEQYHENKIDPKLHNLHIVVFGEHGEGGACAELKEHRRRIDELEKTNKKLDNLTWAVITAVIIQLVMAGIRLI